MKTPAGETLFTSRCIGELVATYLVHCNTFGIGTQYIVWTNVFLQLQMLYNVRAQLTNTT